MNVSYRFRDFLGPSVGGFLLDSVGFNNMCNYTAGLCLAMVSTRVNLVGFYRCGGHLGSHLENLKPSSILECAYQIMALNTVASFIIIIFFLITSKYIT